MTRIVLITVGLLVALAAGSIGALAWADDSASSQLPAGTRVGGVDVGGLTQEEALERARGRVSALIARPAYVQLGERRYTLTPDEAGVRIDVQSAVRRAYAEGREGSFLSRGWRKLTGAKLAQDVPVKAVVDRLAIRRFVEGIAKEVGKKPVDASLNLSLTSVSVTDARPGRRLAARDALVARLTRRLTSRTNDRTLRAKTVEVAPNVTEDEVFDATPLAITVSRDGRQARLFRRGNLVKTYTVAVGTAEYPTPTGRFVVQTMQKNPAWNVPQSEWPAASPARRSPAATRATRSSRAGSASTARSASTAPRARARWAPRPRTAASACRRAT